MESKEESLQRELAFMYKKYEELCAAYKKAAQAAANKKITEVHDMSHMIFQDEYKGAN